MNPLPFNPDWRPPILETERLVIRPYEEADASRVFPLMSNANSTRYTLWDHHKSIDDTLMFVRDYARSRYAEGVPEPMAVVRKDDPQDSPIGSVGVFWGSHPHHTMELGYWLAEPYWGRGLMVEACRALIAYSFETFSPNRIQARVLAGNAASIRVLEKLGFQYEGTLRSAVFRREQYDDVLFFSVLKSEWPIG